jgi:hypothetical protein
LSGFRREATRLFAFIGVARATTSYGSPYAEAVVLDLVNPLGASRWFLRRAGQARLIGSFAALKTPPDFVGCGHVQ